MQCIHSWQWSGGRSIGRLPVVVWIHGGGQVAYEMFPLVIKYFWYGYYIARASCYDGADLVIQSNHGVVAIAVYSVCLRCTLFDPQMYSPLTRFPCRRAWKVGYYRMTQICVYLAEAGRVCSPTRPAWRRPTILLYFVSWCDKFNPCSDSSGKCLGIIPDLLPLSRIPSWQWSFTTPRTTGTLQEILHLPGILGQMVSQRWLLSYESSRGVGDES
jgi:hypothetical protein